MTARLLKLLPHRPTFFQASVVSLCLHAAAVAAVVAVEMWLLAAADSPRFGGRRVVVQMQAAPSPPLEETSEIKIAVEQYVESAEAHDASHTGSPRPVAPQPTPDAAPQRRRTDAPAHTERSKTAEYSGQADDEPQRAHEPIAGQPDPPTEAQAARPLPRQTVSVRPPSIAVAATLPAAPGTDDESPPDFAGNLPPAYPPEAYLRGIEGRVLLRLFISETGRVERVEMLVSSGHEILDRAAVEAVRRWRGTPAYRAGVAVPTVEQLPVLFRLRD